MHDERHDFSWQLSAGSSPSRLGPQGCSRLDQVAEDTEYRSDDRASQLVRRLVLAGLVKVTKNDVPSVGGRFILPVMRLKRGMNRSD